MKRMLWAVPAIGLLLPALLAAQANVGVPQPAKRPAPGPVVKPSTDCRPEPTVNANGELEFTGCTEKAEHVNRSTFDPTAGPGAGARAASATDMDPETRAKEQAALRAKYEYQAFSFAHAQRTFDFQYRSGRVIFWVVLLIVFAGLAFSAVQFYVGLHHPLDSRAKTDGKEAAAGEDCVSEFEATLQGVKLKSSVLGLIILAMSMVFFYLYLKYVYPISNITQ
jgi:uncharacterized membrane protein YhaH (DUF805 family)